MGIPLIVGSYFFGDINGTPCTISHKDAAIPIPSSAIVRVYYPSAVESRIISMQPYLPSGDAYRPLIRYIPRSLFLNRYLMINPVRFRSSTSVMSTMAVPYWMLRVSMMCVPAVAIT